MNRLGVDLPLINLPNVYEEPETISRDGSSIRGIYKKSTRTGGSSFITVEGKISAFNLFPPLWALYNGPPSLLQDRAASGEAHTARPYRCCRPQINPIKTCGIFKSTNLLREICTNISTSKFFSWIMLGVVLADIIHPSLGTDGHSRHLELMFVVLYLIEMIVRLLADGIILHERAYFRRIWNVFDFFIICVMISQEFIRQNVEGYESHDANVADLIHVMNALHSLRAIRIFRTVYTVRSLQTLIGSIGNSIKSLGQILLLSCFWLIVFALIGLQLFMGKFKHRCVLEYEGPDLDLYNTTTNSATVTLNNQTTVVNSMEELIRLDYDNWVYNENNWEQKFDWEDDYLLCGNVSGSRKCGSGFVCLELSRATNPYGGKQSFDNIESSLLTALQLTVLDEWTNVYRKVVETTGPISTIYFIIIVFFGGFQLINTVLALIDIAYQNELEKQAIEEDTAADENIGEIITGGGDSLPLVEHYDIAQRSNSQTINPQTSQIGGSIYHIAASSVAHTDTKYSRALIKQKLDEINKEEAEQKKGDPTWYSEFWEDLEEATNHKLFEIFIGVLILCNVVFMAMEAPNLPAKLADIVDRANLSFTVMFTIEALIKILGQRRRYFKSAWNCFDLSICLLSMIDVIFSGQLSGISVLRAFRLVRVVRLAKLWPTMKRLLSTVVTSLPVIATMSVVTVMVLLVFTLIGMNGLSHNYTHREDKPRFRFDDFWHSLSLTYIIFCGEFIEPLFECFDGTTSAGIDPLCLSIILPIYIIGNLLILNLYVSIILNSFSSAFDLDGEDIDRREKIKSSLRKRWNRLKHSLRNQFKRDEEEAIGGEISEDQGQLKVAASKFSYGSYWSRLNDTFYRKPPSDNMLHASYARLNSDMFKNKNQSARHSMDPSIEANRRSLSTTTANKKFPAGIAEIQRELKVGKNVLNFLQLLVQPSASDNTNDRISVNGNLQRPRDTAYDSQLLSSTRRSNQPKSQVSRRQQRTRGGAGLITDVMSPSEQNTILLEMIIPKQRLYNSTDNLTEYLDLRQVHESYDNKEETVVCEPYILNGQPIVFKKCKVAQEKTTMREAVDQATKSTRFMSSTIYLETETRRKAKGDVVKASHEQEDIASTSVPQRKNEKVITSLINVEKQLDLLPFITGWQSFRNIIKRLVGTWYFELFIILCILVSTIALALEDIYLRYRPKLELALYILNIVLIIIFTLEFLFRLTAMGFLGYFTNVWCLLDVTTLVTGIIDLIREHSNPNNNLHTRELSALRALRAVRALRPLRVVNHWNGMKVIVNALLISLPSVGNVLLLCCVVFLIFSIVSVNLFSGKMDYCHYEETPDDIISPQIIQDRTQCEANNLTWSKPFWNFDHVGEAYFFLFGVVTFDNWIEAMIATADAWEPNKQPVEEQNYFMSSLFIILFSLIGSLFIFNLFIGVMIDSFNRLKKQLEGHDTAEALMTETQRHYYHMLKKLGDARRIVSYEVPDGKWRRNLYRIVTHQIFENVVLAIVIVNIGVMCFNRYGQSAQEEKLLDNIDSVFVVIFTAELVLKLIALSYHYFKSAWNVLDFIIVLVTLTGRVLTLIGSDTTIPIKPSIFRALRVFRVARAIKLINKAAGIRRILTAMLLSMPALCNIAALLLLVVIVYSVIGMQLFMYIRPVKRLNEVFNFKTIGGSMMVMFRMMTGVGWTFVMESLAIKPPLCNNTHTFLPDGSWLEVRNGDCGSYYTSIIFCISYVLITFYIIVNCYIAIILDKFEEQSHNSMLIGEDDIRSFYEVWNSIDIKGTQFIKYEQLSSFLDRLAPPLRIAKPNRMAISILNINVSAGMKIHCLDVLQRLVLHNLSSLDSYGLTDIPPRILNTIATEYQKHYPEYLDVAVMSTTKELALTEYALRRIQHFWRAHRTQRMKDRELKYSIDTAQTKLFSLSQRDYS